MKLITQYILKVFAFLLFSCKQTNNLIDSKKLYEKQTNHLDGAFLCISNCQFIIRKNCKIAISICVQNELSIYSTYDVYYTNAEFEKYLMIAAAGKI